MRRQVSRPIPRSVLLLAASFAAALAAGACDGAGGEAGTPTNPVDDCVRAGDVCRLDDSRLGVCVEGRDPENEGCEHQCYTCAPQH